MHIARARVATHVLARVETHVLVQTVDCYVLARVVKHVLARVETHVLARVLLHVLDYYSKTCLPDLVAHSDERVGRVEMGVEFHGG